MKRICLSLSLAAALTCAASNAGAVGSLNGCGNGTVSGQEQCDDGNLSTRVDGCTQDCRIYPGYQCVGSPSVCTLIPLASCGNGSVDTLEACDDGNNTSGDGCQNNCTVQEGFVCQGSPSQCAPAGSTDDCGNGALDGDEECDDANTDQTDGCLADCTVQQGYVCTGEPSVCSATLDVCGDGIVGPSEECDDADTTSDDGCGDDCDIEDGFDCDGEPSVCEESGGQICRGSQFWATRGTNGSDATTIIESVLDQVGSIQVCGQTLDSQSDLDDLGSALEALCVRTDGDQLRELYRALVTTALNCAISAGGTCDEILADFTDVSFTECSSLCEGNTGVGELTIEQCIDQLECFNEGGQVLGGDCALGTCASNPDETCGGDFGDCATTTGGTGTIGGGGSSSHGNGQNNGNSGNSGNSGNGGNGNGNGGKPDDPQREEPLPDTCVRFEGNCADAPLCNTEADAPAQVCLQRLRPVNRNECREARRNECTIESCN